MPLPFIIAGAAAIAGGVGIAKGVSGAKKISEANDIISLAESRYNGKKTTLDKYQEKTTASLDELGKLKLDIWESFKRFSDAFERIKNKPQFTDNKSERFKLPKHELDEIKSISITALDILGSSIASAGAGALAGVAAYGGTMTFGIASTGTAIGTLSGAAATKATLAALGGGSIASGGGGMALGSAVLGGVVAGPLLMAGGFFLNAKGNSSLQKAEEVNTEVNQAINLMNESIKYMDNLKSVSDNLTSALKKINALYIFQIAKLEYLVFQETDYNMYSLEDKKIVDNNIMLVKLLKQMTQVDLIKKENGKDTIQSNTVMQEISISEEVYKNFAA